VVLCYRSLDSSLQVILGSKTKLGDERLYITGPVALFEDAEFFVPEHYHEYLTQMFGDYMKLPPVEQRQGLHCISVDFGEY
jgi:lipopolysaccharide cholinephosphotransferase